jgi:hypothetical protein
MSQAIMLHDVALPDGWRYENVVTDQIVITAPGPRGGCVTVDLDRRGFRLGYGVAGRLTSEGTYKGRGWKQALVAAAIRRLDSVI